MVRINKINFLKIVSKMKQMLFRRFERKDWRLFLDYVGFFVGFWSIIYDMIGPILIGRFWPSGSDQSEISFLLNRSRMCIPHISISLCKIDSNIWVDIQYNTIVILFETNPHWMRGTVCHCYKFLVFWKIENWNSFRNEIGL